MDFAELLSSLSPEELDQLFSLGGIEQNRHSLQQQNMAHQGPHQSLMGGLLGGAGQAIGNVADMKMGHKQDEARLAYAQALAKALRGRTPQMGDAAPPDMSAMYG